MRRGNIFREEYLISCEMYSNINEEEIIKNVDLSIKRNGTFDKIKKEVTERLKDSAELQKIEKEIQSEIETILNNYGDLPKEGIHRLVRSKIQEHSRLKNEINRQAKIELDKPNMKKLLNDSVREKVSEEVDKFL
ncbi:unnamed protein product [Caenorhabditis angaria]|uniref:BOD1/SHG1 domain-containing protein n=1 Tax=Caenorhabditis angaria TaxID=860376 RepID=A0A9P1IMQ2_9PELO|nr:unnamed protein product [Caenorhabditis angaria]